MAEENVKKTASKIHSTLSRLLQYGWKNAQRLAKIIEVDVKPLVEQVENGVMREAVEFALRCSDIETMKAALGVAARAAYLIAENIAHKEAWDALKAALDDVKAGNIAVKEKLAIVDNLVRERAESFHELVDTRFTMFTFARSFMHDVCMERKDLCKEAEGILEPIVDYLLVLEKKWRISREDMDALAKMWVNLTEWVRSKDVWTGWFDETKAQLDKEKFEQIDAVVRKYLALHSS